MVSSPRTRQRKPLIALVTIGVLALLMLGVPGSSGAARPPSSPGLASLAPGLEVPPAATPSPSATIQPLPTGIKGPFDGHYFNTTVTGPLGAANYGLALATDPSTDTAFVGNYVAGTVNAFGIGSGSVLRTYVATVYPYQVLSSLGLDTVHHLLYVGVQKGGQSGWVLVLNESTFALVQNLSFSGYPASPFEPAQFAYDPISEQMFIENSSRSHAVAINASTFAVRGYLSCGIANCRGLGFLTIPSESTLVWTTDNTSVELFNTTTDALATTLNGPQNATTGLAAFDSRNNTLIVTNSSSASIAPYYRWNATSHVLLPPLPNGPVLPTAMAYDQVHNALVVTDRNATGEITTLNASTGARTGFFNDSRLIAPFSVLSLDPNLGVAIASGVLNNTTISFRLPTLSIDVRYSSSPLAQVAVAIDPSLGEYFVSQVEPNTVAAYFEATGTMAWQDYANGMYANALAVDPATGTLYTGNFSSSVGRINASTGSASAPLQLTGSPMVSALGVDSANHLLYVAEVGQVQVYTTSSGSLLGTVPTPGLIGCFITVDSVLSQAYISNCRTIGNVTTVHGLTPSIGKVYAAGNVPYGSALTASGQLYVANDGPSNNITILDPAAGSVVGTIHMAPTQPTIVAYDRVDNLLFVSSEANRSITVFNATTNVGLGTLAPALGALSMTFDGTSGTLVEPGYYEGLTVLAHRVAVPATPTSVSLTWTNGTISASWSSSSQGGAPVVGYNASIGTTATGPWMTTVRTTHPNATFSGLTDGTKYFVVVNASNVAGTSARTTPVNATPLGVPYPPAAISVFGPTNSTVNVSWQAPASTGGAPVTNYTVEYRLGTGASWTKISAGTVLAWKIGPLPASTNVTVTVVAWNPVGAGHPSAPATTMTLATPAPSSSAPSNKISSSTLYLGLLLLVILAAIVSTVLILRRRRSPPTGSPPTWTPPAGASATPTPPPTGPIPPSPPGSQPVWSEK